MAAVATLAGYQVDEAHVTKLVQEPVSSFTVTPGCESGDGVASALKSIKVTTQSGKNHSMIHKTINVLDDQQKAYREKYNFFKTEILFYDTVIPLFQRLAKARGFEEPLPVPKFIGSSLADTTDAEYYVCVEDVRPQGFQMKDKFAGLNFEETKLVMEELAKFHALGYLLIKWEGEKIFETTLAQFSPSNSVLNLILTEGHHIFSRVMTSTIEVVAARNAELGAKIKTLDGAADVKTIYATSFKTDTELFPVIAHGDLWLNNILFKYDARGCPTELKFIDFQLSRRGNIFEDLQYFIFTSTTPAFRKQYLHQVLNSYYDSFTKTMDQLNFSPPSNFSRGFFMDSFRNCYIPAYRYLVFAIPLQLGTPMSELMKMAPGQQGSESVNQEGGDQAASAAEDADPLAKMLFGMRLALETSPRALERLETVTQELVDLKLL